MATPRRRRYKRMMRWALWICTALAAAPGHTLANIEDLRAAAPKNGFSGRLAPATPHGCLSTGTRLPWHRESPAS